MSPLTWMALGGVFAGVIAACVGDQLSPAVPDAGGADASPDVREDASDASADASAACDLTKPFGAPALVAGSINSAFHDDAIWLLPDETTAFTSGTRPLEGGVGDFDLMMTTRATKTATFGPLSIVAASTTYPDRDPIVTGDGKTLYFSRGYAPYEIWVAERANALVPFGAASAVGAPLNGGGDNQSSWVSQDGTTLYFASTRAPSTKFDIWVAKRESGGFGAPVSVPSLNSSADDYGAVLTADQLQVFFASTRDGNSQIYVAQRPDTSAGFSLPTLVMEIASSATQYPTYVSPDGCTLYFSARDREGGLGNYDVLVATRGK